MINQLTITRYLARIFVRQFFFTCIVVLTILCISSTFDILHKFKSDNMNAQEFWLLVIYKLPYLFNEVIIIIGFIATVLFIQVIRRHNELIILLSNGISMWRILFVPISISFLLGAVIIVWSNPLGVYCLKKYAKLEAKITGDVESNIIISPSGIFLYEQVGDEQRFLQARSIHFDQKRLSDVTLLVVDEQNNLLQRIDSKSAIVDRNFLTMRKAIITSDDSAKQPVHRDLIKKPTHLSISHLVKRFTPPEMISMWQLHDSIIEFSQYGLSVVKYQLHYFKQMFKPLTMLAMSSIACWFVSLNLRNNSNARNVIISLVAGMCAYFFLELLFRILCHSGLSPLFAILIPISFIILISNFVILHYQEA